MQVLVDIAQDLFDMWQLLFHVLHQLQLGAGTVQVLAGVIDVIVGIAVDVIHQEADAVLCRDDVLDLTKMLVKRNLYGRGGCYRVYRGNRVGVAPIRPFFARDDDGGLTVFHNDGLAVDRAILDRLVAGTNVDRNFGRVLVTLFCGNNKVDLLCVKVYRVLQRSQVSKLVDRVRFCEEILGLPIMDLHLSVILHSATPVFLL